MNQTMKFFLVWINCQPCGLMDKTSDFESEGCGFESRHGYYVFISGMKIMIPLIITYFRIKK